MHAKRRHRRGTDLGEIAEQASELLSLTANVAEDNVKAARERLSQALERGKEISNDVWDDVVSANRSADEFVRKNPYAAVGIGVALGVLVALLWRSSD